MTPSLRPLAGIRVLDLSRVLAGPMCAMALGDLGAEVIKVEHPERGDDTRDWGVRIGENNTSYFDSANRNKQSICLDLQTSQGQSLARELALQCDVVIQNFKPGGAERLGMGYDALRAQAPQLVYCSISGYSAIGPEAARPGYDLVVQGEAGLMAINGEQGQGPLKFGVAAVDMMTGMYAAQAILAVLYERHRTGVGRHVQMALYDCGLAITSYCGMEALLRNADPLKFGNSHPSIVPYGVFDAADGPLVIAVGNNGQFRRFCTDVIVHPEWADDPRFGTNTARSAHRHELVTRIAAVIAAEPRAALLARLHAAGIPCGEVQGLLQALRSRRTRDAELLHVVESAEGADAGEQTVLAPPYAIDDRRMPVRLPPPRLGEHTDTVLRRMLGADDARLAALRAGRVI